MTLRYTCPAGNPKSPEMPVGSSTSRLGESTPPISVLTRPAPAPQHQQSVTSAVVQLLESADRLLSRTDPHAHSYIARATALLRTEQAMGSAPAADSIRRPIRGGLTRWQLRRVTDYVEENLKFTIRTSDVAARAGLSTSYFFHAFRCTVGESPYAYVVRRRIERAQELMLLTEKPLSEIALDCGLTDQPHLTRLFRRLVGASPAAWRRQRKAFETHTAVDAA
jgi:AraC family transcriptional regulator